MLPSLAAVVCALLLVSPGAAPTPKPAPVARQAPMPSPTAPPLVLVLRFAPASTPDPDWLSAGVAAFMVEGLELSGYRTVDPEAREEALEQVGLAEEPRITLASACEIARRVGARYVVTGTWRADATRLDFMARLIDVQRLKIVRRGSSTGHVSTMASLLGQLVLGVAGDGARAVSARHGIEALATTKQEALLPWMQAAAEPEAALTHLDVALKADPVFAPALLDLAEARLDAGEPDAVPRILATVPGGGPETRRSRLRLLEGRALLALGDHSGAIMAISDSVRLSPQPDRMLWLAEAQLAAGQRDAAKETAGRVLSVLPGDQHALDLVEQAREPADDLQAGADVPEP